MAWLAGGTAIVLAGLSATPVATQKSTDAKDGVLDYGAGPRQRARN